MLKAIFASSFSEKALYWAFNIFKTAAASELPPPMPPATGIFFSIKILHETDILAASPYLATAFQHRLRSPQGTSGELELTDKPAPSPQNSSVILSQGFSSGKNSVSISW